MLRNLGTILAGCFNNAPDKVTTLEAHFKAYFTPPRPTQKLSELPISKSAPALISELNQLIWAHESDPRAGEYHTEALAYLISEYGLIKQGESYVLNPKAVLLLKDATVLRYAHANNRQLIYLINDAIKERIKADFKIKNDLRHKNAIQKYMMLPEQSVPKDATVEELEKSLRSLKILIPESPAKNAELIRVSQTLNNLKGKLAAHKQKNIDHKLNELVNHLGDFLYYVDNPTEEDAMQKELEKFLKGFHGSLNMLGWTEYDLLCEIYCKFFNDDNETHKINRWYFLNTLYMHYQKTGGSQLRNFRSVLEQKKSTLKMGREFYAINQLLIDLMHTQGAHLDTDKKIPKYKRYMFWAGFAFGMEIAMVALENLALMSNLGPLGVLGFVFVSSMLFGILIGHFFKSAHVAELQKQLRFEYFHDKSSMPINNGGKGAFIAKWGTRIEGTAASVLLITLGAFIVDMVAWAVAGGSYDSALPGLFFGMLSTHFAFYIAAAVIGITIAGYSIMTGKILTKTHYSLDGKETEAYYNKKQEDECMRSTLTTTDTQAPLYFAQKSWRHNIGEKLTSCFPSLDNSFTRPIHSL